MKIMEIEPLENGAHRNQELFGVALVLEDLPEGWAMIPEELELPETYPFVDIEVQNGIVTAMTAGVVPEPEREPTPEPTELDRLEAQVAYTAMMTDTLLEEG